ncbi:SIR2 family protein [Halomonas cupida]|uniref:hypothetical protein n=1 Tax=Halomonas cupida TaxID=44933 RepID=UPI0039B4BD3B
MKRDTVLLFGAGASYDSEPNKDLTPPLGAYLFNELEKLGGAFSNLPADQKKHFESGDFESGMASIKNSNFSINPLQNELAIYLSGFLPSDQSAYTYILKNLPNPMKTTVCTLNYDLLIEESLIECKIPFDYRPRKKAVPLLKIHGSSNFLPMLKETGLNISNVTMENCAAFVEGIYTKAAANQEEIIEWTLNESNSAVSPVMSMYNREKRVVVNRGIIESIQKNYRKHLSHARLIVISGVRFLQHDTHIWDAIRSAKGKVVIVDPFPEEALKWLASEGKTNIEAISDGFFNSKKEIIKKIKYYN